MEHIPAALLSDLAKLTHGGKKQIPPLPPASKQSARPKGGFASPANRPLLPETGSNDALPTTEPVEASPSMPRHKSKTPVAKFHASEHPTSTSRAAHLQPKAEKAELTFIYEKPDQGAPEKPQEPTGVSFDPEHVQIVSNASHFRQAVLGFIHSSITPRKRMETTRARTKPCVQPHAKKSPC